MNSLAIPMAPVGSRSILVNSFPSQAPETRRDSAGRAGTQSLGQSWDSRRGCYAARSPLRPTEITTLPIFC